MESQAESDTYYSKDDLEELRNKESSVLWDVKSHLLEDLDEDAEDYKLVNDAKSFKSLLTNCNSLHAKAEIEKEVAPWQAPARSTAAVQEDDTEVQDQRRTRRM